MSFYEDGFKDHEDIIKARNKAQELEHEWHGKIITSIAAANGAGILALLTYLSKGKIEIASLVFLFISACIFLSGLYWSFISIKRTREMYWINSRKLYTMGNIHYLKNLEFSNMTKEQIDKFFSDMDISINKFRENLNLAYNLREKTDRYSIRALILGIFIGLAAISYNTYASSHGTGAAETVKPQANSYALNGWPYSVRPLTEY